MHTIAIRRHYLFFVLCIFGVTMLSLGIVLSQEFAIHEALDNNKGGVLSVRVENAQGDVISQVSGVVVARDLVATNCHVISNTGKLYVAGDTGDTYGYSYFRMEAKLLASEKDRDLCLLVVNGLSPFAQPVPIGSSTLLSIGEEVFAMGAPLGNEQPVSRGNVSQLRRESNGNEAPIIHTDISILPSWSGGGLFNADGELIGITSREEAASGVEDVAVAIPTEWIGELMPVPPFYDNSVANEVYSKAIVVAESNESVGGQDRSHRNLIWALVKYPTYWKHLRWHAEEWITGYFYTVVALMSIAEAQYDQGQMEDAQNTINSAFMHAKQGSPFIAGQVAAFQAKLGNLKGMLDAASIAESALEHSQSKGYGTPVDLYKAYISFDLHEDAEKWMDAAIQYVNQESTWSGDAAYVIIMALINASDFTTAMELHSKIQYNDYLKIRLLLAIADAQYDEEDPSTWAELMSDAGDMAKSFKHERTRLRAMCEVARAYAKYDYVLNALNFLTDVKNIYDKLSISDTFYGSRDSYNLWRDIAVTYSKVGNWKAAIAMFKYAVDAEKNEEHDVYRRAPSIWFDAAIENDDMETAHMALQALYLCDELAIAYIAFVDTYSYRLKPGIASRYLALSYLASEKINFSYFSAYTFASIASQFSRVDSSNFFYHVSNESMVCEVREHGHAPPGWLWPGQWPEHWPWPPA